MDSTIVGIDVAFPVPGLPLIATRLRGAGSAPHYHVGDIWEVNYVVRGEGYYFIGPQIHPFRRPTIVFSGPNDIHWCSGKDMERLSVVFSLAHFQRVGGEPAQEALRFIQDRAGRYRNLFHPDPPDDTLLEFLFVSAIREMADRRPLFDLIVTQYVTTILTYCRRLASNEGPADRGFGDTQVDLVRGVLEYVDGHLAGDLHLSTLARIAGVNATYLSTLFNRITGHSVPDYVTGQRVLLARRLLETTELKVIEVSLQAGFASVSSFNRAFLDRVRVTPRKYRKICKERPKNGEARFAPSR